MTILLKEALKGNSIALTEITYQFQFSTVPVEDLIAINNSTKNDRYSRYLQALSFYFYTPDESQISEVLIKNNENKLLELANKDNMPLAQNLVCHYYTINPYAVGANGDTVKASRLADEYRQLAINQANGLATLNYFNRHLPFSTIKDAITHM